MQSDPSCGSTVAKQQCMYRGFLSSEFIAKFKLKFFMEIFQITQQHNQNYRETNGCEVLAKACQIQNSTHNGIILPSPTPCSCCETCLVNLEYDNDCSIGLPGAPLPNSICGNGLYCAIRDGNQHPSCEAMLETSKCYQAQRKFDNDLNNGLIGHLLQRPKCDGDGNYKPLVCLAGQNCFCVNEDGQRIFGDGLHQTNIDEIMHCGCARLNDKLKDLIQQSFPFFTTRCNSDGSFDALQCFADLCVCVDERTGSPTSEAMNLTIGLSELPCYDKNIHHDEFNYARPCENIKQGLINSILEALREGAELDDRMNIDICSPDGRYAPIQENDLSIYCADGDGNRIEDFVVPKESTDAKSMNCKCARTRKLLMDASYLEIPDCCPNGNYKRVACRRGFCYCVDADGKQVSVEVIDIHKDSLPCFRKECDYSMT